MRWMDLCGILSEARNPAIPASRAMRQPSLQLIGGRQPRDIGLQSLSQMGVRCVGRVLGANSNTLGLSADLGREMKRASDRCARLLERIDTAIADNGIVAPESHDFRPPEFTGEEPTELDLEASGIRTIVWATGFRRSYPWLDLPVLDADGELCHSGGITEIPGLYALGLPFMRRRNSTFIDGVGADARELSAHLSVFLGQSPAAAA
jgi:putative flavoprotein involved in K+ transport